MNYLTAAETIVGVIATAGIDDEDGYVISENDYIALGSVARWLLAGAISRGETISQRHRLPTGTLKEIELAAIKQALEDAGGNKARACAALGINNSTLYRITNGISQSKWGRPKGARNASPAPTSLAADEC